MMRQKANSIQLNSTFSIQAISGTHVITLGWNLPEAQTVGLLGFSIERTELPNGSPKWLDAFKVFKSVEPVKDPTKAASTEIHPIQDFFWSDFTVHPHGKYRYRILARKGMPTALTTADEITIDIEAEHYDPQNKHDIYFNRGVAGSQAFVREFGTGPFSTIAVEKPWVWEWLSRGLREGLTTFLQQASDATFAIRAAIYEFQYEPILTELGNASRRGVDVKIVYCADNSDTTAKNEAAIQHTHIENLSKRRENSSGIPHNKFIILLKNNVPIAVWTGSTNITTGGIFGHSNLGHLVRDTALAQKYLTYWTALQNDTPTAALKAITEQITSDSIQNNDLPSSFMGVLFSPRRISTRPTNPSVLDWYAKLMQTTDAPTFITVPFGLDTRFENVMSEGRRKLIYVLSDKADAGLTVPLIKNNLFNRIAHGAMLGNTAATNGYLGWVKERLTGLNNIYYLHTKYLLIDPLGDTPLVISGSANFSTNSIGSNDENMLVIKGDKRVAEMYFGEFMRVFKHFYFRSVENDVNSGAAVERIFLDETDAWRSKFYNSAKPNFAERQYFSGEI